MTSRLIGLMMIRDEQDMLAEALRNHVRFCDAIFVLDGTQGDTLRTSRDICLAFPQVVGHWQDDEAGHKLPLRDGARQFLLERARERFGLNHWYAILHGDEIWSEDPRLHCTPAQPDLHGIAVNLYHFFPHISQRDSWSFHAGDSIEALAQWYMLPPIPEHRLFWDSGSYDYVFDAHSRTIPSGMPWRQCNIILRQYNYRTPEQAHRRAVERKRQHWQENHYQHLLDGPAGFFVNTLAQHGMTWAHAVPVGGGRASNVSADPLPAW